MKSIPYMKYLKVKFILKEKGKKLKVAIAFDHKEQSGIQTIKKPSNM